MTTKCVKSFYKYFEVKNFYETIPNFDVVYRIKFEIWHFFADVFDFKVLAKTFRIFSSHVIDI